MIFWVPEARIPVRPRSAQKIKELGIGLRNGGAFVEEEYDYPLSAGDEQILERLDTIIQYLDAMNQVMVSIEGYLMLTFWICSLAAGVYIGLTFWGKR